MANPSWFIALPVDADEIPRGLIDSLPAGLHRFPPADLHLTVAFLGDVSERDAERAWLRLPTLPGRGFVATAGRLAALGRPARPSAYGFTLDDPELRDFLVTWRDPLRAAAGIEPERRQVLPHVTLARPPRRDGQVIRARAAHWLQSTTLPRFRLTLRRIALYTGSAERPQRLFRRVAERELNDLAMPPR